jgi:hypothetical protein
MSVSHTLDTADTVLSAQGLVMRFGGITATNNRERKRRPAAANAAARGGPSRPPPVQGVASSQRRKRAGSAVQELKGDEDGGPGSGSPAAPHLALGPARPR